MRFAVITSNSYFSYVLLSRFIPEYQKQIDLVVEAKGMIKGKRTLGMLGEVLRRSGLAGFSYKVGIAAYSRALDTISTFTPFCKRSYGPLSLAKRHGIEVVSFTDVNAEACLDRLQRVGPDLIYAVNVYQLLKPPLLALPKIGVINFHFGMLPHYRGMSPYMWALARGEREVGVTVHFMDERFDTGDIISQKCVPIKPTDSACGLYVRCCLEARSMLIDIARQGECGDIPRKPQARDEGSYFPLPGPQCVSDIKNRGHALVRVSDLIGIARGTPALDNSR